MSTNLFEMITTIYTKDYYFDQIEEKQVDLICLQEGTHKDHHIKHTEDYENCGVGRIDERCQECHELLYANELNGCWQYNHQREEYIAEGYTPYSTTFGRAPLGYLPRHK